MLPFSFSPIIIIFALAFFLFVIFLRSSFECTTYEICDLSIANNKNSSKLKLVFISDFHNKLYKTHYKDLIVDILAVNPDYIVLGGDFINYSALNSVKHKVHLDNAIGFIESLVKKCKENQKTYNYNLKRIFFGFGNHELRLKENAGDFALRVQYDRLINTLTNSHIEILDNSTCKVSEGITISGLSLYKGYYNNIFKKEKNYRHISKEVLNKYFNNLKEEDYNIALFHKPDYAKDLIDYGFDLVLSGHNHGGLIRLPIIGSVFSPDFKLFPKLDSGLYRFGNKSVLVSSGIGEHFIRIRLNNLPKVYVINIV